MSSLIDDAAFLELIVGMPTPEQCKAAEKKYADEWWADYGLPHTVRLTEQNFDFLRTRYIRPGVKLLQVATPRITFDVDEPNKVSQCRQAMRLALYEHFEQWKQRNPDKVVFVYGPQLYVHREAYMGEMYTWCDVLELSINHVNENNVSAVPSDEGKSEPDQLDTKPVCCGRQDTQVTRCCQQLG